MVPFLSHPCHPLNMWNTCPHVFHMYYREGVTKMIQIRNVPDEVHRQLKVRAAQAGMSLSDFLNVELARVVAHRPLDELVAGLGHEPTLKDGEAATAVRAGRRK